MVSGKAWCFIIDILIKDEELLLMALDDPKDAVTLRTDLKLIQLADPAVIESVMCREWLLWLIDRPRPAKSEKRSVSELLCFFMEQFSEAAAIHQARKKLH